MSVMTVTRTDVRIRTQTRSVVFVCNEMIRILVETVRARGLPLDYLQRNHELFSASFRTWLAGRWLNHLTVEVYDPKNDRLVEKYILGVAYEPEAEGEEVFESSMNKLQSELTRLRDLRPGCRYEVLVNLSKDAPDLPGWSKKQLRDASHLCQQDLGAMLNSLCCKVQMMIWAEEEDQSCK